MEKQVSHQKKGIIGFSRVPIGYRLSARLGSETIGSETTRGNFKLVAHAHHRDTIIDAINTR